MANFDRPGSLPAVDLATHHQAAANARTDRHVKHGVVAAASTEQRLGECGRVGVIVQHNGPACLPLQPVGEAELFPASDLVALGDCAGGGLDGPAKTNPAPGDLVRFHPGPAQQAIAAREDLLLDFGRLPGEPDGVAFQRQHLGRRACSQPQLQFGATDFNAHEQAGGLHGDETANKEGTNEREREATRQRYPRVGPVHHPTHTHESGTQLPNVAGERAQARAVWQPVPLSRR